MNRPKNDWMQEGREVGITLDACHAVVVVGSDAIATSEVALGIARVQAQHRRVAIADMFGDAPPLQELIGSDDPHGLVDSFLFGVSLNRIAHRVPDAGELFVIPSGTGPLDYEELFLHPRWRKLAAGFAEVGALLLIVAPAHAEQIRALVDVMDGAVLVGDAVPADLPVALSLAWIRSRRTAPMSVATALPPAQRAPTGVEALIPARAWRRFVTPLAGLAAVVILAALALWFAQRPFAATARERRGVTASSKAAATVTGGALSADGGMRIPEDSVIRQSSTQTVPAASDSFPRLPVANPFDSAGASAFAVLLEETLTKSGAILNLEQKFKAVPVGTFGINPRTRFFPVFTGAYATAAEADSLLNSLRASKVLSPKSGSITSVPYAFLIQRDVSAASAGARVARFRASGHPVYALRQSDGRMRLYFGAYATPQQAALAVPALRDAKLTPTLVYRTGRVF